MVITILIIAIISIMGIEISFNCNEDYLKIDNTRNVKGIFVGLVFLAHVVQYITLTDSMIDKSFDLIMGLLGQNIVIVFLFYSGYGISEAIKKSGDSYIARIVKHRILKNWLHFVGGVLLYFLLNLLLVRKTFSIGQYMLSLFALQSIGNSTWFIFAILVCWFFTWVAFKFCRMSPKKAIPMLVALLMLYIVMIKAYKNDHCWYDAILCYPLGMIVSYNIQRAKDFYKKNGKTVILFTFSLFWVVLRLFVDKNVVLYEIQSLIFAIFMLTVTTRVQFNNKILSWLGDHTFSIYILQRIPMIILTFYGLNKTNRFLFVFLSAILTCIIAECFNRCFEKIDKLLGL